MGNNLLTKDVPGSPRGVAEQMHGVHREICEMESPEGIPLYYLRSSARSAGQILPLPLYWMEFPRGDLALNYDVRSRVSARWNLFKYINERGDRGGTGRS
jgi:hypothetical protein